MGFASIMNSEVEEKYWKFTSQLIKTDVTCIKYFQKSILSGIGGNIHVSDLNGKLLDICNIFPSQRIYGIVPYSNDKLAVFGGYQLKTIEFKNSSIVRIIDSRICQDWILAVHWLGEEIAIAFANNFISIYSNDLVESIKTVKCKQRCLIYSAHLINDTFEDLCVFSGTVFREVLIWKPYESGEVLCRLKGHDGVIFSINYSEEHNLIVTTSDDRTLRLWSNNDAIFKKENNLTKVSASLKKIVYGHTARVFRSKITDKFIITSGEDSFVYIWNLNGIFERKIETQSGCIWSLDCTDDNKLVIGGGDSNVSLFTLNICNKLETLLASDDVPRAVKIMNSGAPVVITDRGILKYYKYENWKTICQYDELKTYAVLEISRCRSFLALAGFTGSIHIYKETDTLINIFNANNLSKSRIYSLHFLSRETILTSENNGILQLWLLRDELLHSTQLILPPSKERWCTKAVMCGNNHLAVGDRKGNIYLFNIDQKDPIQTIKKAQTYLGITYLDFNSDINQLVVLGRSGIIKKFNFDGNQLYHNSNDKLPFSWLASFEENNILGFSGSNFVIWDQINRRILYEIDCGGGHRSWDFYVESDIATFIYIKEKTVLRSSCKWSDITSLNIVPSYHSKEINTLKIIRLNKNLDKFFTVSGGEDTTVRISSIQNEHFKPLIILKAHLSSVRALAIFELSHDNYLLVSAGGRSQIILWEINVVNEAIFCKEIDNYYKPLKNDDLETRIMDVIIYKNMLGIIFVAAACSDGILKLFKLDLDLKKINLICDIKICKSCILKISFIKFLTNFNVILCTNIDGELIFWDSTNICMNHKNTSPVKFRVHQSGINSFHYKEIFIYEQRHYYIFATGGDDNAVIFSIIYFEIVNSCLQIHKLLSRKFSNVHGAQICGTFFLDNCLVVCSIDHYISVFEVDLCKLCTAFKDKEEVNELECRYLPSEYCSVIADIQGMDCMKINNDESDIYSHMLCIYGNGLEILKFERIVNMSNL